jgi:hypothetical protein
MSQRATAIQALGLRTYLNELNAGDGALKLAENVNIDEKGVISQRRGLKEYGNTLPLSADRVKQIFEYKDRILRHFNDKLQYDNGSGVFSSFDGSYSELESGLRIKYQESNGNMYFTTSNGIKKISALNNSQFTTASDYIIEAGVPKAIDIVAKVIPDVSGFLLPESKVAYRIIFGYKDANNNLLYGYPSSRYVLTNTSKDIFTYEKASITVSTYASLTNAHYILFSSETVNYAIWFNLTGSNTYPINSDTLGKTLIEVNINGLTTNNQVAAKIASSILAVSSEFDVELVSNVINITAKAGGDLTNISAPSIAGASVSTTLNGAVSSGTPANAEVSFTIPPNITTNYFYQIYRTAVTTLTEGLLISDIDPGDEMRLVYEEAITDADLVSGTVVVDDITPETFRNSGANLYTNPISGEGILQANDRPPIAKDIELFKNSMFYANTKSSHKLQFSLLGVTDFVSGTSKFILGNSIISRSYTFVGTKEVTQITCGSYANTLQTNANNSYILINSANDERKYYIWFTKGAGVDPQITDRVGIVVNISDLTGAANTVIAQRVYDTLLEIDDFDLTILGAVVTATNVNNGPSTNATTGTGVPSVDIGTGWALSITNGTGQDASIQQVLLSGLVSASQAIEETARSLIYVINQDSLSPVMASYLSGENDLPGQILLENKLLQDDPFYLAVNEFAITQKFSPSMTETVSIGSVTYSVGINSPAKITDTAHGLSSGTSLFISSPDTTPAIYGVYPITVLNANEFTIPVNITVEDNPSTDTFYFTPSSLVSDNLVSPNRIYFSKTNQPEAVPLVNYVDVGPKDEPIQRIVALRDNLFVFKTDGVYILSGSSASNFSIRLLDNSTSLTAPDSAAVLNNQIYCLSTQGVVSVSDTGVSIISRDIENLILNVANNKFSYQTTSFGVTYESDRAYIIWLPSLRTDTVATQCYRYNTFERTWTKWTVTSTCGIVSSNDDRLYLGSGNSNYVLQERKENDRTDFADRQFNLSIGSNAVNDLEIRVSTASNIEIGDVLYQDQYITIAQYNRLLRKLDLDKGLDDDDYESTLKMEFGDNISTKLNALNAKLVADDTSSTITVQVFSSTWATLQVEFNDMIDELNNVACDTLLKNYKEIIDIIPYEAIVTAVNYNTNVVTTNYPLPFEEGAFTVFKAIKSIIQWQPLHFGDPSGLKQIRESTIMFDQNNFYSAALSFASDLSQGLVMIPFQGKGVGYWGYGEFGNDNFYWGGDGNDAPFRTIVPLEKQRCRYLTMKFNHNNAREKYRILGVSSVVRAISSRAYR